MDRAQHQREPAITVAGSPEYPQSRRPSGFGQDFLHTALPQHDMDRRHESPHSRWPEQHPALINTHSSQPVELPHPYTSVYHSNQPAGQGGSQRYFSSRQPSPAAPPPWDTGLFPLRPPLERWPGERPNQMLGTNRGLDPREMAQMALAPAARPGMSASTEGSRAAETLPPCPIALADEVDTATRTREKSTARKIQRRTKTGCLTCRKRRIKCDEQRPACNNCTKAKRECLGYEVLFREHNGVNPLARAASATSSNPPSPNHLASSQSPSVASLTSPLPAPAALADYPTGTHQAVLESVYSSLQQPPHGY
ncbi:uncharacterized protein F5Z01DRAFT_307810 [Emericellopsis atlantica]|uniref:Zn(2)-C6 fungal-type domain-containing protein n=1 Tax=Emericellopsis atlantica TaxID=2614577 RepID=A0A9P7ZTM6_9HYPO|nr:uncharacterized protein F5Z01DRAFT_307810 [Emericellopsis atlantica]KAG9257891.1 hypothetical protein F5Z01DRAFT_307810 [Emericellopsis atlantica]